jgi:outer membrane protein assembly factor BamB
MIKFGRKVFTHPLLWVLCLLPVLSAEATAQRRAGVPMADVNRDAAAENLLFQARELARIGAYDRARNLYEALAELPTWPVMEAEDLRFEPIWLLSARDLLSWPEDEMAAYRRQVEPRAARRLERAAAAADLVGLEAVGTRYLVSESGSRALAMLAGRLLENGDFALACYYYDLLLRLNLPLPVEAELLQLQARRAAALAGRPALRQMMESAITGVDGDEPGDIVDGPAEIDIADRTVRGDHCTPLAARLPATARWEFNILNGSPLGSRYPIVSTPLPYPVARNGRVAFVFQTRAFLLGAADGQLIWQYDSVPRTDEEGPVQFRFEQAHRPKIAGNEVITPISRGDEALVRMGLGAIIDVMSLDLESGQPNWRWTPRADLANFGLPGAETGPLVSDHRIFSSVTTMVNFFGEVQMVSLNRATGECLWQTGVGAHGNMILSDIRETSSMPMTTSLAHCGGIVFTAGPGLVTAHSAVSGRLLWAGQLPMKSNLRVDRNIRIEGRWGRTFGRQLNDRLPQLLLVDGMVVAGGPADNALICCDMMSGSVRWIVEGVPDNRPVALRGRVLVTWGSTLSGRSIDNGETMWTLELPPEELIAASPLVAAEHIYLPTTERLLLVDVASGRIDGQMHWPPGRVSGNLHLAPEGLLVGEPSAVVCYEFYDDAVKRLEAVARRAGANRAAAMIELADLSIRVAAHEGALRYLEQAIAAGKSVGDAASLEEAYERLRVMSRQMSEETLARMGPRLLELMSASATNHASEALQAMEAAAFHAATDKGQAIEKLRAIFERPELREVELDDAHFGRSVAGVLAEKLAGEILKAADGDQASQLRMRIEESASAAAASAEADDAASLRQVAMAHLLSDEARQLLRREAALHVKARQHGQAVDILRRLLVATEPGLERAEVRLLLANALRSAGRNDQARYHLEAASRSADIDPAVKAANEADAGAAVAEADRIATEARRLLARHPAVRPPADINPPGGRFKEAWSHTLPTTFGANHIPVVDGRSARARASQPLIVATPESVHALHRGGRARQAWQVELGLHRLSPPVVPMLLMDGVAVIGAGNRVLAVNPANGQTRWAAHLQPPVDLPAGGLMAAWTYGSAIWSSQKTNVQALAIDYYHGHVRVLTDRSVHLLDVADGFSHLAVGRIDQPIGRFFDLPENTVAAQKIDLPGARAVLGSYHRQAPGAARQRCPQCAVAAAAWRRPEARSGDGCAGEWRGSTGRSGRGPDNF